MISPENADLSDAMRGKGLSRICIVFDPGRSEAVRNRLSGIRLRLLDLLYMQCLLFCTYEDAAAHVITREVLSLCHVLRLPSANSFSKGFMVQPASSLSAYSIL